MTDPEPCPGPLGEATALGHLGSGVGHHVINAFSAIVSNAEILRLSTADHATAARLNVPRPDPAAVADVIIRTALDAATVARRLIDYTRGPTVPRLAPVALDRVIAATAEARSTQSRPGVAWAVEGGPVPPVSADVDQIRAMLDLLLDNALESLPDEGGTIRLSVGRDARDWVVIEVADSGVGMAPGVLERAVEPFYSTKPGHLGVGLSVAHGIWRRHRGTLALESVPGRGTVVRLGIDPAGPDQRRPVPAPSTVA